MIRFSLTIVAVALAVLLTGCVATEKFLSRDTINPVRGSPYRVEVGGILELPKGATKPPPVVIVLESCGGDTPTLRRWMSKFNEWGYAAFLVRSLEARGAKYCSAKQSFYPQEVASDAYGAIDYIKANQTVDNKKIALIGFSLGAGAINESIMVEDPPANGSLVGVISFYFRCERSMKGLNSVPMLQVTATRDVRHHPSCSNYSKIAGEQPNLKIVSYDAHHAFDDTKHVRTSKDVGGNEMLFDPKARDASELEVKRFLDRVFN